MQENEFFKDKDNFSEAEKQKASHSLWYYSWIRFKRNKLAMAGLITLCLLIIRAITAGLLAPFDPNDQTLEYATKPSGFKGNVLVKKALDGTDFIPIKKLNNVTQDSVFYLDYSGSEKSIAKSELISSDESKWHRENEYLLGTDRYGRDILSRLIYGSRISLSVGVISESIAIFIGVFLGALAGYFRGKTDAVIMWFINVVWSFPSILFIIALSVVLGKGFWQSFEIGRASCRERV